MRDSLRKALFVAGFLAIAIAGYFGLRWMISAPPTLKPTKSLEAAWGEAIGQFAIEPVFPPEEDLAVGDVLAYVTEDNDPAPVNRTLSETSDPVRKFAADSIDFRTPSLKRSVKVAHVDVRQELQDAYAKLAVFPATVRVDDKTSGADPKSASTTNVARFFTKEVRESDLPRAAFANLKSEVRITVAGAVAATDKASASYGGGNQGYEEFKLSDVSTYGLPAARALEQLKKYCSNEQTKDDCQESIVRRHLQPIVGDRVFTKYLDPQGNEFNAVEVGLVIVSRVYLARSIVHKRRSGRAESGGFFASLFSSGSKPDAPAHEPPAPRPSNEAGAPATDGALMKRVQELEKQVAKIRNGGGFSAQSSASDESEFDTGRLDRPVAFGFRYVRFEFPKEDGKSPNRTP